MKFHPYNDDRSPFFRITVLHNYGLPVNDPMSRWASVTLTWIRHLVIPMHFIYESEMAEWTTIIDDVIDWIRGKIEKNCFKKIFTFVVGSSDRRVWRELAKHTNDITFGLNCSCTIIGCWPNPTTTATVSDVTGTNIYRKNAHSLYLLLKTV